MSEINYADILPSAPSQELLDMAEKYWAETNAIVMNVDYITDPLTDQKNKVVHCHCTACNNDFYSDYTSGGCCYWSRAKYGFFNTRTNESTASGSNTLCPECGAPVRAISISDMYRNTYSLGRTLFTEVKNIESKVCIISWEIYKEVDKKGKTSFDWYRNEAYIADGKKTIRCSGQRRYFNSYQIYSSWMQTKRFDDCLGRVKKETLLPFGEEVLIGTSCENSKLDLFAHGEEIMLVSYLRLWQKHPNIENLVMQGHANLVNEALLKAASLSKGYSYSSWRGSTNVTAFDFKKVRPHEMLKLSKEDYIGAVKNKLSLSLIEYLSLYREYDRRVTPGNVSFIHKTINGHYGELQASGESLLTVCNYIAKQEKKYPDFKNRIEIKTLLDYWNMSQTRSEKTGETIERYPQNLVAKHDQLVELAKFERQKELLEAFAKRAEKLTPFAFADEETGLMIFACPDEAQLIKEGKTLHHCVATYAKPHAQGNTAIFFIRHTDKPDEPFFFQDNMSGSKGCQLELDYCNYVDKPYAVMRTEFEEDNYCPECERTVKIGYACGEHFVVGSNTNCPCCDAFNIMRFDGVDELNCWEVYKAMYMAEKAKCSPETTECEWVDDWLNHPFYKCCNCGYVFAGNVNYCENCGKRITGERGDSGGKMAE